MNIIPAENQQHPHGHVIAGNIEGRNQDEVQEKENERNYTVIGDKVKQLQNVQRCEIPEDVLDGSQMQDMYLGQFENNESLLNLDS